MRKLTYAEMRANGICTQCGKVNPEPSKCRCPECMERTRQQRKENRAYALKIGVCTVCKSGIPYPGKKICEDCLEKMSDYRAANRNPVKMHEVYKRRKAECEMKGLCIGCKKRRAREGHAYCVECYIRRRRKQISKIQTISRSERPKYGLCYVCGKELDNKTKVCTSCRDKIFKERA